MAVALTQFLEILAERAQDRGTRVSLNELARRAGLSPSHFQRTFARLVGESPKQFVRRLQLEYAAAQLVVSQASILDIALESGFESHEGFSRAFRAHFGSAPRAFRAAGILEPQLRERHAALIQSVGPCLHLFRTPLDPKPPANTRVQMNYDITRKPLEATYLLCKQMTCPHAELSQAMAQCLPAAFQHATANGIAMMGPPITRYLEWGPGVVTIQGGVPVPAGSDPGELQLVEIPACEVATTIHTGPYDGLGDAHAALETFLHENGLKSGGPALEVYLTDPGEVPDPAEWKTLIQKPIAS